MKPTTNRNSKKTTATVSKEMEVDVLYQKLGGKWFAISEIEDEVYFGTISAEELSALERGEMPASRGAKTYKIVGNS